KNKFFVQECRITTKNGEALDLEVMTTLILRKGSLYTIFAMKDIGDEKRREALERIFFHDVLNSAGGISGLSSILLEEKDPEKVQQIIQIIQRTSEYLVEEIKSQQQLFKAEHGDLEVAHTELNSVRILKEVAELYSAHKVSNKRNIVVKEGSPVILFYSDSVLLRRVLGNMIKNALEATPEGGTVELSCKNKNGSVRFCVHNDGFMDDEIQLQVFQRSFTTKGIGRGLGTYGMKLLGEKYLGGKVGFESTEEKGTTFYLELPIKTEKNKT
ncbi:MAG: HAMP domain-containing histidine kinase, partial [Chlorobi bacterium]|nr:HAMP domain-containing histidine kinase [Chlorobiota bacterium]